MANEFTSADRSGRIRSAAQIIIHTLEVYNKNDGALRAASLAYHLLLSFFPLLLFLISIGSRLLEEDLVRQTLDQNLQELFPGIAPNIGAVLDQVIKIRGSIGILSAVLLLWSGSAAFQGVASALNAIWGAPVRAYWRRRLIAITVVLLLGILFIGSVWFSTLVTWAPPLLALAQTPTLGYLADFTLSIGILWLVHRILPNRRIPPLAALAAAVCSASLLQVVKFGYAWFLLSGLSTYGLVYGSLATAVVLMLWVYFSATTVFLGASFGVVMEGILLKRADAAARSDRSLGGSGEGTDGTPASLHHPG